MSSTKTNAELLKSIKQFNKVARETRALKLGFKTAKDLITFLEGAIKMGRGNIPFSSSAGAPATKPPKPKVKVVTKQVKAVMGKGKIHTIHVVDVLDASGSMTGGKYDAAVKGINLGIESLKADTEPVEYTYTLCDFSDDIVFRYSLSSLDNVSTFKGHTRGSTALYDAIGKSIEAVKEVCKPGDKVLVNIYTDGQENASRKYSATQIAQSIRLLSELGWTFTFIGTASDVNYAQANLHFHSSNTLVHENTPASMERSFAANNSARTAYSKKVSAGEDVSKGFYKDIN